MKIKTSELTGVALDWAVAKALGEYKPVPVPNYSTNWTHGGPIIEREKIGIDYYHIPPTPPVWISGIAGTISTKEGKTPLIAAMRCYVASKLGNEVDIPEELL